MSRALAAMNPRWGVELGTRSGPGWLRGRDLRNARVGPFNAFLAELGRKGDTSDRRTIAASFALRFGWSSGAMIAAYVFHACVPRMALDNVSFFFSERALFERLAVHSAIDVASSAPELRACLREDLIRQAEAVVEALSNWSHLSAKGLWGLMASSWGGQFVSVLRASDHTPASTIECVRRFFDGDDVVFQMQPNLYRVTIGDVSGVYYRAAACCRHYLRPEKQYCAMCPLISQEDRVRRNTARIEHPGRTL